MISNKSLHLKILKDSEIEKIKETSSKILEKIGFKIYNDQILNLLKKEGFRVDDKAQIVKFPLTLQNEYISIAVKNNGYTLYGRNLNKKAIFGAGFTNIMSSSGQYKYHDWTKNERRDPTIGDVKIAAKITTYLDNIDIVGAFFVPLDIDPSIREIEQEIALLNNTDKPIALWFTNGTKTKYQLEIMKIVRDGQGSLKQYPFCECFIEAISPLKFTKESMENLLVFAKEGLPIGFGPMAMQGATAPATIAGTVALENAEILAGIIIAQVINPGVPVTYWGIPHAMDLTTGNMSFASPEQSLLALSMVEVARHYGFKAIGVNEGLSDSNLINDAQSGFERGISLINGIYSGADILAHQGIIGQDSCGSLIQLIIDDQMLSFLKRYFDTFRVDDKTIAYDVIKDVGIDGNYLVEPHTIDNIKKEIFVPEIFNRNNWETWNRNGRKSTMDNAIDKYNEILKKPPVQPIDDGDIKEIRKIIDFIRDKG